MTWAVRCVDLSFGFDGAADRREVLRHMDFGLQREEFVAVVGRSGCGKTTLLRLLAGLLHPDSGCVQRAESERNGVEAAVVFQGGDLFPWKTALANVEFGRVAGRESPEERRRIAREHLARVDLGGSANLYPRQLSLGMQRRVSVARAFASGAELLLLDEPFANLDSQTRWLLQQELLDFWRSEPRSVVFVTHDIAEAIWLADRVVVLGGRPTRVSRETVVDFARPRDPELRWTAPFRELEHELWQDLAPAGRRGEEGLA